MTSDRSRSILGNPFFLGSLGLLILNDQFLKSHFGNAITGKLSDFAGLFVVGFLVVGMARHHQHSDRLALLPIVIIFGAAKTIPAVTNAIVTGLDLLLPWSSSVVTDPSDLIALLVLPLAPLSINYQPIRLQSWARNGLLLTTVVACTATSQLQPDPANLGVGEDGRILTVRDSDLFGPEPDLAPTNVEARPVGSLEFVTVPRDLFKSREAKTSACSADDGRHCFRIDRSGSIEETLDGGGTWSSIWKIVPTSYASLAGAGFEESNSLHPLTPRDLEVTSNADLVVLLGDSTMVTRSSNGVWVNPDSAFRPVTFALVVQLLLASIVLYGAVALGLEMFKPKMLWIWIPVVLLAALSLGFGVLVSDPSFPMFEILALLLAAAGAFFALLAFRRPKTSTGSALLWGLMVPPLLTILTAGPVGVWKYANFSTFETMATLSAATTLAVALLIYLMAKGMERTVELSPAGSAPSILAP